MFYSRIMKPATARPPATIWMADDSPTRMVFAGRRWRVTDTPTRLKDATLIEPFPELDGWRFHGTDGDGVSLVFDVFEEDDGWHVHRSYE